MTANAGGDSSRHPGPNAWLLDELRSQFEHDPDRLDDDSLSFFATAPNGTPAATITANDAPALPPAPTAPAPTPAPTAPQAAAAGTAPAPAAEFASKEPEEEPGLPLRGAAAAIVNNMQASLEVPTATSFRDIPAKMLEANRRVINGYLRRSRLGKVSFTHLIAWAAIRAIADHVPAMNSTFSIDRDGKPRVEHHDHIGLGVAVDVHKSDGSRTLLVPTLREADTHHFRGFVAAYDDLIERARRNKLSMDDFGGTTVSLTNPGGIGTVQSVPRLMPNQGVIVGVGTIALPAAWQAADPRTVAELGISKVVTITSTYDHRIIQGAESGEFLAAMHRLLMGEHGFYTEIFDSIGVPYTAINFNPDRAVASADETLTKQIAVNQCVNMHRVRGHLIANLDPLGLRETYTDVDIDPETYGLTVWDLDREFLHTDYANAGKAPPRKMILRDILGEMRDAYCRTVGIDYMHIQNAEEKRWIQRSVEGVSREADQDEKRHILERLGAAEALESFLDRKYPGTKRFGLEGGESAIPILDAIIGDAADNDMGHVVLGMAHRGRLNVLVNIVGKTHQQLFREFEVGIDEDSIQGSGDVKYHLGMDGVFTSRHGNSVPIKLAANPSHLEAVNPVVEGVTRAMQDLSNDEHPFSVLPLLIHGDAAFAGQGVVSETLHMSQIKGWEVGGTVHLIINNQVGFTTTAEAQRSSTYPTDVARTVQAPILHVNGDDPEACVWAAHFAFEYRERWHKDVVIDMWCYRRRGHNEGDDPSYTQPLMYRVIDELPSVRNRYLDLLVDRGDVDAHEEQAARDDFDGRLQAALDATREAAPPKDLKAAPHPDAVGVLPHVHTAIDRDAVDEIYAALAHRPDGFTMHPKLVRQFERRDQLFESGRVDWAIAEAMAMGSLLREGTSVRLTGQDSRRGTFSHRHSTLVDHENGDRFTPLEALRRGGADLWIYDSMLSEYAALGFEYGYSLANPDALTMWEAQFGDFVNGAQIVIDQFIVGSEDKWKQQTGLVLLLPHGYEGQGPEHSSARVERVLLACAEDNIQVANATTAAQFFHLLRRQMMREVRKPLFVFTPKSLLRSKHAQSPIGALTSGTFEELLDDPRLDEAAAARVRKVVICTGKIGYAMMQARDEAGAPLAVLRAEQLYPWPEAALAAALRRYTNARDLIWLQEEPENMGAWNFVKGRLYERHGDNYSVTRVSRHESGSPATGSLKIHQQEEAELIASVLRQV